MIFTRIYSRDSKNLFETGKGIFETFATSMQSFYGYLSNPTEALQVIQLALDGFIPRTLTRTTNPANGSIFVYIQEESGIKRFTDGLIWTPSRIESCFLVYHQVKKFQRDKSLVDSQAIVTSKGSYQLLENGLTKKTLSIKVKNDKICIVCYHSESEKHSLKPVSETVDSLKVYQFLKDSLTLDLSVINKLEHEIEHLNRSSIMNPELYIFKSESTEKINWIAGTDKFIHEFAKDHGIFESERQDDISRAADFVDWTYLNEMAW